MGPDKYLVQSIKHSAIKCPVVVINVSLAITCIFIFIICHICSCMKYISYTPFDDQMLFYFILFYIFLICYIFSWYGQSVSGNRNPSHQSTHGISTLRNTQIKKSKSQLWRILFTAIELYYSSKYPLPATTKYTLVISPSMKWKFNFC